MRVHTSALGSAGLKRYEELRREAINTVADRFNLNHSADFAQFGPRGREACLEDLAFHLEFLRPVLEFGLIQPMLDYLRWLQAVLASRDVPAQHLPLSLDWLAEFFAAHMEQPDADIVVRALHETRTAFLQSHEAPATDAAPMLPQWPECADFERSLLAGNRHDAEALFEQCLGQGHGLVEVELSLIQPALYNIGQKWQNNQVSVAQEHLATAIAQSLMTRGLLQSSIPASNGNKVLLACVAGNNHSVGLQMIADAFHLAGWDVQFLGANVPTKALIDQIGQYKPQLVALSVSFAQQLRVVKEIMAQLAKTFGGARPPVIIGGHAINQFNSLAVQLGADAWKPDAGSALAFAANLASTPKPA